MSDCYVVKNSAPAIPIYPLGADELPDWLSLQTAFVRNFVEHSGFVAAPDRVLVIPNQEGHLERVLLGVVARHQFWHFGGLPRVLPAGTYELHRKDFETEAHFERALLAFGLGAYQFNAYREQTPYLAKLSIPESKHAELTRWLSSIYFIRDMVNLSAEDMGPPELAEAARQVAKEHDASIQVISGDALLDEGYRAVHAVGRAGARPPCVIDLQWGDKEAPKVTLVGKGVCFDSGGLDIKPAAAMALMKKDMGGAAHALGLGRMIMAEKLPVRLRILIPAVENAVGSLSYRPGDVILMRNGLSVEIGNTDAEGRLVLADVLVEAVSEDPELLIDFATLTGDARRALGPEIPAFFCNNDALAAALLSAADDTEDPFWRLPLYQPYVNYLKSDIAHVNNNSRVPMAGAIVAALFLQRFVSDQIPWAHFDLYAWNLESLPGRPCGGEAFTLRAVFHYLRTQFMTRHHV